MHVGIIGCGLSGIGVAKHLHEAGVPFTIFEKSRTVGGRMAVWRVDEILIPYGSPSYEGLPDVEGAGPGFAKLWSNDFKDRIRFETRFESFSEREGGFLLNLGIAEEAVTHLVLTQPGPQLPEAFRPVTEYKTVFARVVRAENGPATAGSSIGRPMAAGIQCIYNWGKGVWTVYLTDETAPWEGLFEAPSILKAHRWLYAYPKAFVTAPKVPERVYLAGDTWVGSDLQALWARAEGIAKQILAGG